MWALCRAVSPLRRSHSYIAGLSRSCSAKLEILTNCVEHGVDDDGCASFVPTSYLLPDTFFNGLLPTAKPFLGSRSFSSQARKKTINNEDDLEDGFSDLETPHENDKANGSADGEAVEHLTSETDLSEVESGDDSGESDEEAIGFSDIENEKNGDKPPPKKTYASSLSKVIIEAPRLSLSSAIDKWVSEGNTLGRSEIYSALFTLRRMRLYGKALQFLEWLEANKHLDSVERDYASRLDLVAKVHGLFKAEKYIDNIPESFRGELVYRTLLANCVSAVKVVKAEETFNRMRDLGFPVTAFACNQLLLLYKRLDRKKIADVLLMMEKENVKPSLFTFKLLIDTKGRSNDIAGMEKVVESMKNEGLEPDLTIQAMIARHYLFSGFSEKAAEVLKEMEGDDIKENRGACKSLLFLYAALGKEQDVERIWKVCEASPRLDECLAAIEAWGKLGHVDNAEAVFDKMSKQFKRLSSKYYNSLLKVYANHKLLAKGKELAKQMSDSKCNIGPLTWDALVNLYVQAGEVEKADSILQKATQQNKGKPLYSSFMAVMEKYSKRGEVHNAEKIFHRMRQHGYLGRVRQYQVLLQTYINAKTPAYGFKERMKADNIFPNKTVTAQLVTADAFKKSQISELLD
uniref:Pentatricopeptide repeat-containing protein At1g80270, mitochondrial n=1 Tax=Anthurium amnicola TaxID=1678845 RepID=A0A1D1ZJF9_9ARAE